ncbi:alpha/beta fold hydrolase [Saccharopolyspora sp. HNM0983]|uniref:Alpha/beta fold hydrolase n=1 Tax=Saccharopolyspora montiporae TaxID=2781240 RepID=A0A929B7Q5_9PSEU|nr:alpha/beta fold hydrolase [Saccharopolyspora sp. HNM0983]MBE9373138.1 alpha/beta fold hydrolase [Saccharopolyspora sp. HNM0983]
MPVLTGAEPLHRTGSSGAGVLLCHGFTSTPQSVREWGEHLAAAGATVRAPLLPGHGTRWQDLNRTRWTDWYAAAETELDRLRQECRTVFVFGQSMGGTIALRLAERHPDLAGLVLVNPSVTTLRRSAALLPVLSRVIPALSGLAGDIARPGAHELAYDRMPLRAMASLQRFWRVTRADLAAVHQPVLLYRSATDHIVEPVNAQLVLDGVSSSERTEIVLPDSFHVATLDHDAPALFAGSVDFLQRIHRKRAEETV